jgi:plastocyanin
MTGAGGTPFVTTSHAGKLVVLPADARGDCNADGTVNAGDFSATALELFDIESDVTSGEKPAPESWLWTPLGDETFSARGCDSNADRTMQVSDLQCTVRLFFGATCTAGASVGAAAAPAPAPTPAVVSVPAAVTAGQGTAVPLVLRTNTHDVSAFAASVSFDPAKLKLDPTDSDADGVPDAVHFQLPAGMYRMATYDAAAGTVDLVATGIMMPLPTLPDGVFVTLTLAAADGATGTATALTLDNLSLGDSAGGSVPAVVETTSPLSAGSRVFLPAVMP